MHVLHLVPGLTAVLAEAARVLRRGGRVVALHGTPEHDREHDGQDAFTEILGQLDAVRGVRKDSAAGVRAAAADAGLRCVAQEPSSPRAARYSPAQVADLIERRAWSYLWSLADTQWQAHVAPAIDALRALPEPDRPREQRARMTVSVLEAS